MHLLLPVVPSLFILASSVCRSLWCLISALTQGVKAVTYLGSLVQLGCGEGGTLQTNIAGMCGECSQCMDHTGFVPGHSSMCFPSLHCSGSRLLRRGTVQLSKARPAFSALPRSKLHRLRFSGTLQGHRVSWVCVLYPSQVGAAQVTRCLASALSQVGHMS